MPMNLFNPLERAVGCFRPSMTVARFDMTGKDPDQIKSVIKDVLCNANPGFFFECPPESQIRTAEVCTGLGSPYRESKNVVSIGPYIEKKFILREMEFTVELPIDRLERAIGHRRLPEPLEARIIFSPELNELPVRGFFDAMRWLQQTNSAYRSDNRPTRTCEGNITLHKLAFKGERINMEILLWDNISYLGLTNPELTIGALSPILGFAIASLRREEDPNSVDGWKILEEGTLQFLKPMVASTESLRFETNLLNPKEIICKIA